MPNVAYKKSRKCEVGEEVKNESIPKM